jgi:hypothetical protein
LTLAGSPSLDGGMSEDPLIRAFQTQSHVCGAFGSPFYDALCARAAEGLDAELRALFAPWNGETYEGLMTVAAPLRFLGALHDLALAGEDGALTAAFPPEPGADPDAAWAAAQAAVRRRPERFAAFMTHEPQTNETRRSACLLPGFLEVSAATGGLPLACVELGASAGLNQLWWRYAYDYGAAGRWGDPASPVALSADWSGPAPRLAASISVARTSACDRAPIDVADPAQRRRLKAYLWPDQAERIARFDAAAGMAVAAAVTVERADAAEFVRDRAAPAEGAATVVFHSVFWQYLPPATQAAIRATMQRHGETATASAPLAWLRMEPEEGKPFPLELRLTVWPGGQDRRLAAVQAHGASVTWEAGS